MTDLWPESIGYTTVKAPVTILREQAALLGSKTKNLVVAEVSRCTLEEIRYPGTFTYKFILKAPALSNYTYQLFAISNDTRLYPVKFVLDEDILKEFTESDKEIIAKDEYKFIEIVKRIFNSEKTKHIVSGFIAQSVVVK